MDLLLIMRWLGSQDARQVLAASKSFGLRFPGYVRERGREEVGVRVEHQRRSDWWVEPGRLS